MKWFGSVTELVAAVFRKNSQSITLRPNQTTTYTAARDIQLPEQNSDAVLISRNSVDTLTGKSIDGDTNTLSDIGITSLKTEAGDANEIIRRDNTGAIVSGPITVSDAGAGAGFTQITVDNLDLNGNTVSTTSGVLLLSGATAITASATGSNSITLDSNLSNQLKAPFTVLQGQTGGSQPQLRFSEDPDIGIDYVAIQAPASVTTYTLTLPPDDGDAGEVLSTNGSGVLDWASSATVPAEGAVYSNGSSLQTAGSFAGNANEVVGVNSGATAVEYKALAVGTSGTDFAIAHAAGSVTFNLPDASASNRGAVTTGNQTWAGRKSAGNSKVRVNRNGSAQSIPAAGAVIQWTTENFDTNGEFDNATNYRFTATKAGYYLVNFHSLMVGMGSGDLCQFTIRKNGTATSTALLYAPSSGNQHASISDLIFLNGTTDYIDTHIAHNSGTNENMSGDLEYSHLDIHEIV